MRGILDAIRGTVRLRVTGARPERMLNILSREGIWFSKTEREDELSLSFTLLGRDADRAGRLAAGAYFDTELLSRKGLPALARRIKRRFALYIMPPLCVLTALVLSLFIWEIEVTGSETISDAQILAVLEENGIGVGTFGLKIDRELLRDKVIAALPKISWMTVNVQGCRAEVIIRERTEAPEIVDQKTPADVIAARTGLISELSVFQGQALVKKGDTVLQGELLISGTMPSIAGETRHVHSQGVIKARTWYEISEKIPLEYISKLYTGETIRKKSIIIGNYRLNLYLNGGISLDYCDKIIHRERLSLGGLLLPLEIVTAEYMEYVAEPALMSEEDAAEILKARLTRRLEEETDGEPLYMEFETASDGVYLTVTLRAECLEDIGQTVNMGTPVP